MDKQKISPLVERALSAIDANEWKRNELQNWFNNANNHPDLTDYERELLIDRVGTKIRFSFPLLAKKVFGAKDSRAVEMLSGVVEHLEQNYDLSENRVGNGVKIGGDQIGGRDYVCRYISYKSHDGWNVGLLYRQKKPDTEPFLLLSRHFKGVISNPDSVEQQTFAVDDIDIAVSAYKEELKRYGKVLSRVNSE